MSRFWEIIFCVLLLFSPPCLLSNLKHSLPVTACKTVLSHLKRGVYAHVYTSFLSFCGFFVSRLLTFPSYFINAILFYFILLKFNKSNWTNIFLIYLFYFFLLVRQASSSTSPFSRSLSYELHELKKKRKLADRRAYKQQCNLARNLTKTKGNP